MTTDDVPDAPLRAGLEALAETAWLAYRDDYMRANPWCDARRAARQMRKREFIAGYLASHPDPAPSEVIEATLAERVAALADEWEAVATNSTTDCPDGCGACTMGNLSSQLRALLAPEEER